MQFSCKHIIITCICFGLFASCAGDKTQNGEEPLAKVYDKYLYPSDIKNLIDENTSKEDSAKIVSEFVDSWVRHNLILKIAEDNLQSSLPQIDEQAKEYRESLVIYAYEKQWLSENLDTIVQEDSLLAYYNAHPQEFLLKQDIFKLSYAVVDRSVTSYDSLRNWFTKDIEKFRNELETYCLSNCKNYLFNSADWLSEDVLFRMLPLQLFENNRLRNPGIAEYADETGNYIVKVNIFKPEGSAAPYEYVKNDIRQTIIGERKMAILKKNYQDMYMDGMKKEHAEIY